MYTSLSLSLSAATADRRTRLGSQTGIPEFWANGGGPKGRGGGA